MSDQSPETPPFTFNDDARLTVTRIGRPGTVIARIDDLFQNPASVAALGLSQSYTRDPSNLYPGLRSPMPASFSTAFRAWLAPILQRGGLLSSDQSFCRDTSFFSVVTTASGDLLPIQRIPHYDSTDPSLFAAVIYLCDRRFGGTSFYRHRKTGYEEITENNQENYHLALDREMRLHGPPKKDYINGNSLQFDLTFSNELAFNSAIIYPGRILHAANIAGPFSPPRDQSEWRLTITSLLQAA
jgi:hypothetical protein